MGYLFSVFLIVIVKKQYNSTKTIEKPYLSDKIKKISMDVEPTKKFKQRTYSEIQSP